MSRPAPYPADTRAKGWRFELDYEQIEQSDTWDLAGPEGRPWLLMMWLVSWRQVPCGSLPADDDVIAAKLGMPIKLWAKHKAVMLRGWFEADDGRLYHPTLTARVIEMMGKRRSDSDRQAAKRARQALESHTNLSESRVTPAGVGSESSTDHRPPTTDNQEDSGAKAPASSAHAPTAAGSLCKALKAAGIARVAPGNVRLAALLAAGATEAEFLAHAPKAIGKGDEFAYLLSVVEGERKRAAANAGQLHQGPMPNRQEAVENRNRNTASEWVKA